MTTFEVSNLGRYGFMGGRGGASLREQSGAMKQAASVGAGIGPSGAGEEGTGGEAGSSGMMIGPDGVGVHPHSHHGHHGHRHSHGIAGICGHLCKAISGPLMQVLGLDRFTKGKAVSGMRRAGRDQNPFDLGIIKVSETWTFPPLPLRPKMSRPRGRTLIQAELSRFLDGSIG